MNASSFEIAGRWRVGAGAPCFLIAEVGMNHNGDPALAEAMVRAAAEAGADAVKFQVFRAESFVTSNAVVYGEDRGGVPARQIDMLRPYELDRPALERLRDVAAECGVCFFATPLDEGSADLLAEIGAPLFKIASCDVTYIALLRRVAGYGRPMILSTGMSTPEEVARAVDVIRQAGDPPLALMQCTSAYPARVEDANLSVIPALEHQFGKPAGLSDHCRENHAALAAVALGAKLIEKHFTTDNALPGVDQKMSLNPEEFRSLVTAVRQVEAALGTPDKKVLDVERDARANGRRGLVAAVAVRSGTVLTPDMVIAKRPPLGIAPENVDEVVGRTVNKDLGVDDPITWECL